MLGLVLSVIEGALAGLGCYTLGFIAWLWRSERTAPTTRPDQPQTEAAASYREGLLAAARLQQTALLLEQRIYAEAMHYRDGGRQ